MKYCCKCGNQLADDAVFCSKCGAQQAQANNGSFGNGSFGNGSFGNGSFGNGSFNNGSFNDAAFQNSQGTGSPFLNGNGGGSFINTPGYQQPQQAPVRNSGGNKLPIIVAAVAVVLVVGVIAVLALNSKNKTSAAAASAAAATAASTQPQTRTQAVTVAETESTAEEISIDDYVGEWPLGKGMYLTVTKNKDDLYVEICENAGGTRRDYYMTCQPDEDGYWYSDGSMILTRYGNPVDASIMVYTGDCGKIILAENSEEENEILKNLPGGYWLRTTSDAEPDEKRILWLGYGDIGETALDQYIIWYSSVQYLDAADLMGLSQAALRLARNEIYARHGRKFKSEDLQSYFSGCYWYNGTIDPDKFSENSLSDVEKANVKLIEQYETGK